MVHALILFERSGELRRAMVRQACVVGLDNFTVTSVDQCQSLDGADAASDPAVGKHLKMLISSASELSNLIERENPDILMAHPSCKVWSSMANRTTSRSFNPTTLRSGDLPVVECTASFAAVNKRKRSELKIIDAILNADADVIMMENPPGRLRTVLFSNNGGTKELMYHQHTYSNTEIEHVGANNMLAKRTSYWISGDASQCRREIASFCPDYPKHRRVYIDWWKRVTDINSKGGLRDITPSAVAKVIAEVLLHKFASICRSPTATKKQITWHADEMRLLDYFSASEYDSKYAVRDSRGIWAAAGGELIQIRTRKRRKKCTVR